MLIIEEEEERHALICLTLEAMERQELRVIRSRAWSERGVWRMKCEWQPEPERRGWRRVWIKGLDSNFETSLA